jgi:protein SCO1/2
MHRSSGTLDVLQRFLTGGGLPAFALSLLFFFELLLVGLLLAPTAQTGLGAFAESFRIWCFGYDPATGTLEWAYVVSMLTTPIMLGSFFAVLWWEPLRQLLARPMAFVRLVAVAGLLVGSAGGALALLGPEAGQSEFPFPAESLRTALPAPELSLINQLEQPIDVAELRGKVVVLTAIYASCPHTCPRILAQAKNAIAELDEEERADLRLIAVTMDPKVDSPEVLSVLGGLHGLAPPLYNLATGEAPEVERILDDMGIARERDPETGIIQHANLFLLLDRQGKLAYRLGLGDQQQRWLVSALRVLLREGQEAS